MKIAYSLGIAGLLLLTGCAQAGPVADVPTLVPTVTPTATPSGEPWPEGKPRLSKLVLSPDGFGPIQIGEPIPAADGDLALAMLDSTYCDINHLDSGHGGWMPNYPANENGNLAFFIESSEVTVEAPVISIWIGSDEIRTAEGFGVGSTIADLNAFYGSSIVEIPGDMATAHVVQGTRGELVFWGVEVVDGVEVLPAGATPLYYYTLRCH